MSNLFTDVVVTIAEERQSPLASVGQVCFASDIVVARGLDA